MFLRSVLLCGLHALALAGLLTEPSADSKVKLEQGSCAQFWYESGTDCYRYVASPFTWADAELNCQSLDANLVSIHRPDEMNFLNTLIENHDPKKGYHWIGFSDTHKEGSWMWSDGSPVDATFWYPGEPRNQGGLEDCVHMKYLKAEEKFLWNDFPCTSDAFSVCKLRKTRP
jgi:hypothetical protein